MAKKFKIKKKVDLLAIPKKLKRDKPQGITTQIQLTVANVGKRVKQSFDREFKFVGDAQQYLKGFIGKSRPKSKSSDGKLWNMPDGVLITSNYLIDNIIKVIPPKEKLPHIFHEVRVEKGSIMAPTSDEKKAKGPVVTPMFEQGGKRREKQKARANGTLVPLKKLCQDLKIEPRAARMKLRKAVVNAKQYPALAKSHAHSSRWEWAEGSPELQDVKNALKGLTKDGEAGNK